jgi:hypothetical protein
MAKDLGKDMRVPANMGSLSLGLNVKFSSRKLGTAKGLSRDVGSNMDLDLASVFKFNQNLSLGLAVQNFVNGDKSEEISNLSTVEQRKCTVLAGMSGRLLDGRITWAVEGEELGCELKPIAGLAIRAGQGKESTTTGIGIELNGIGLDYAYVNKTSPVHYWSISIAPPENKDATPRQASLGNLE